MNKPQLNFPLVSIVIPAFNAVDYLKEAIDSVIHQDYPNIELIVLDDGSTDDTVELLKSYPEGSFYWDTHVNMGQSATLNKGWRRSQGEIISYLSADDALFPDAVSQAVRLLTEHPDVVMVYGDYELMNADSLVVREVSAPDFSYREMVVDIVVQPGPGVFFRKGSFEQMGGWNELLRQIPDYEYWLRLALTGSFLHIPKKLARFRIHETSQSFHCTTVEKSDEVIDVLDHYFSRPDLPRDIICLRRQAIAMAYVTAARFHLRAGRTTIFWKRLGQALYAFPFVLFRKRALHLLLNALKHRMGN